MLKTEVRESVPLQYKSDWMPGQCSHARVTGCRDSVPLQELLDAGGVFSLTRVTGCRGSVPLQE